MIQTHSRLFRPGDLGLGMGHEPPERNPMTVGRIPNPISLYRLIHVDNLPTLLSRGALHARKFTPDDGLPYQTIHKAIGPMGRHGRPAWRVPWGTCPNHILSSLALSKCS